MMRGLGPIYRLWLRTYYDWALREIDPSHPDVGRILIARAQLRDQQGTP